MDWVAKAFVAINEFLLFVFLLAPLPVAYFAVTTTPTSYDVAIGIIALVAYYIFLIVAFGWLALTVQNNRSLGRIVELLEEEKRNASRREPNIVGSAGAGVRRQEPQVSTKNSSEL